jgi:hypothetical protein
MTPTKTTYSNIRSPICFSCTLHRHPEVPLSEPAFSSAGEQARGTLCFLNQHRICALGADVGRTYLDFANSTSRPRC